MKIKSMIALAFTLTLVACSNAGSGNDATMIAAANVYNAAHPVCHQALYTNRDGSSSIGNPNGTMVAGPYVYAPHASSSAIATPMWESAFVRAGLLRRKSAIGRFYGMDAGSYTLDLTSRLKPSPYNNLCFGHVIADSVAKAEPVGESSNKDTLSVEFRSHFAYADWANDPRVQAAIWNDLLDAKEKDAIAPAFNAILVNDPVRGWRAYNTNGQ